jgi:SAM-dependent methyltransferase
MVDAQVTSHRGADETRGAQIYETIGVGYAGVRRPDGRIAAQLARALGTVDGLLLNVGAGTGSYEPESTQVVAVEPAEEMIDQRQDGPAMVVRAVAGALPFADRSFEAAMAVLTVHHWPDPIVALREVRRVVRGPVVVLTFDRGVHARQWLVTEYLPEMAALDVELPDANVIARALGGGTVEVVPVPFDCTDGFCHAWWRRPSAYLRPDVRAGISGIARLPHDTVDAAMARLASDLADGSWAGRHRGLMARDEIDGGYRLVISPGR